MPTTPRRRGPGCSTSRAARAWPRCVRRAPPSRAWRRISPPAAGSTSAPRPPRTPARGGSGSAEGVRSPRTTTPVPYRCSERARWGSAHPVPPGDTVAVHASERLVRARALGRQPALGQGLRPLDDRLEVLPRTEDRGVGGRDGDRRAGVGVARDAGSTGPLLEDPEAHDGDGLPGGHRPHDDVQRVLQSVSGELVVPTHPVGELGDQFGLVHVWPPSGRVCGNGENPLTVLISILTRSGADRLNHTARVRISPDSDLSPVWWS